MWMLFPPFHFILIYYIEEGELSVKKNGRDQKPCSQYKGCEKDYIVIF